MGKGGHGFGGGFGHGGFGHGDFGWGHGPGFFGPPLGIVATGLVAGAVVASCYRPPPRYRPYRERVIVVEQPASNVRVVQLTVPAGHGPGETLEIAVDGRLYYVIIPDGAYAGSTFKARIELHVSAAVART